MYFHGYNIPFSLVFLLRLLATVLAAVAPIWSQQNTLKFDNITMEQGLSDNYVLCSIQDRYGFLWFGTRDGLNRYDGNRFKIYRHDADNPSSLGDGSILSIFEDSDGTLWVGTHAGGLNRFDRTSESFTRFQHDRKNPSSIPEGMVASICEDNAGMLWLAIRGAAAGLARFDRKRRIFTRYYHDSLNSWSISSNNVTSVCQDKLGAIWVGTYDKGLNKYDPARNSFINGNVDTRYSFETTGIINSLHIDDEGKIWVASHRRITMLDAGMGKAIDYTATLPQFHHLTSDLIYAVFKNRSGLFWMGTAYDGVRIFNPATGKMSRAMHNPTDRQSIGSNQIHCITEDRLGNIWIGTNNGVARFNRRSWNLRYIQHDPFDSNSLSGKTVRAIFKDATGNLLVGTEGKGISRIDEETGRAVRYRIHTGPAWELEYSNINVLYQDNSGTLWIGGSGGVRRYDKVSGSFTSAPNLSGPIKLYHTWSMLEDHKGTFWIGTFSGLHSVDKASGKRMHYTHSVNRVDGISDDKILCLFEDSKKNLWVGTDNGLDRMDRGTGKFIHYRNDPKNPRSLSNNRVWFIHEDSHGYFWLATSGGGLNRFNPANGECLRFTEQQGLANNTVCGILEDRHGQLWISTNNGISRLDPATRTFRNYSERDGFYINQFHFKSCFRDSSGRFYFGGTGGIVSFHPDSIVDDYGVPNLTLISFKVRDQEFPLDSSITMKREIHLEHDRNFFTIEFAALDFTDPSNNLYTYQLEGFDDGWRITDGRRPYAEYTNVPPGRYIFHLRGSSNEGLWSHEGIAVALVIEPAYWQTWWFRALVALSGTALLLLLGMLWLRNVRRKSELRRTLVEYQLQALRAQMNPHFIFNALNSILHFILRHDSDEAHMYLSKFAKLIRLTLDHSKSDSVLLAEDLESLRIYIELERLRVEKKFSYEISVAPDIDPYDIDIPPMLIQPYVENAIKHGFAYKESPGNLVVDIRRSDTHILCSVIDNGVGRKRSAELRTDMAPEHRPEGMAVTGKRLEALGEFYGDRFRVDITDLVDDGESAAGTRVDIYIPAAQT